MLPDDFCVGKLVFGPNADVVYGQAVTTAKRRLGFVYCDNRPAHIFKLDMSDGGKYSVLSSDSDQISARQPKFSQESATLLWLERDLGLDSIYPGTLRFYHEKYSKFSPNGTTVFLREPPCFRLKTSPN